MSTLKKIFSVLLVFVLLVSLTACAPTKANCKVISADYAENIPTSGGLFLNYEGYDIFKIVINVDSLEKLTTKGLKDEDFRSDVYDSVVAGCSLTVNGSREEEIYGYWPKSASTYRATSMTLFYLVPEGTDIKSLTFKLDGKVLGDSEYQFTYTPE